ncbi:TetR/AcrR family transcriptional regulator [Pengzhenrongella sicca]|uniref:TetR family transcriptional regulator n=1 Tax=Pengzhenrongella sicca TaxID=2819238 RepID=A0A8A4ZF69_9MICO|nr:helix-turn-helix domain-containing protein [Pengzhenrongella sicca]QTE30534.1 TetR family transcriptional regulator [Pengzhenrongella sicca]
MPTTTPLTAPPAGLRERKKAARRAALTDAALHLVQRDGLDRATVEAICAEAGVSPRTFFNYFASKDDAVLGIPGTALDDDAAETFASGGPTGRLMPDVVALVHSVLAGPMHDGARHRRILEVVQREPRLVVRQIAWLEQVRLTVEGLTRRRLGPAATAERVQLVGVLVLVITRTAHARREDSAGGPTHDHASDVVVELRDLLGET